MKTQTKTSGADTAELGLGSVLVSSLPATLMTHDSPDRYTVEVAFTRRPERDEITEILGSETRDCLAKAGYSTVEVMVSDRRLQIANTNLEELRDGLGGVLADRLAEISAEVKAKQDAATVRFQESTAGEHDRAASVAALAESVTFLTSAERGERPRSVSDQVSAEADDRDRINDWTAEGGHGR